MNKKRNPNTIIPEHYIRRGDTQETSPVFTLKIGEGKPH
jgi:hypothetical protein